MKKRRSELEYDCMEDIGYYDPRRNQLSDAFLRKPYEGTKAETHDDTQSQLHEYDWMGNNKGYEIMNDYERKLFNGRCPYTDEICDRDIECFECEVEEEERHIYDDEEAADDRNNNQ